MSEVDATRPVDEPHTRTRMAWGRTMLALLIVALLLGRSAYVLDAAWAMIVMLVIVGLMFVVWLFRSERLRERIPQALRISDVAAFTAGTAGLAILGFTLILLGTTP